MEENKDINEKPATFDHLIVLLMSSDLVLFDKSFVFSFFLSSRVFMSPNQLLKKILEKTFYFLVHHKKMTQSVIKKCVSRFIYILNQWSQDFPSDFRDVDVICTLKSTKENLISIDESFADDFEKLISQIAKQISDIESYEKNLIIIHHESVKKLDKKLSNFNILNICDDPSVLAKQFSYIDLERIRNIGADEYLNFYMNNQSRQAPLNTVQEEISDICRKNFRVYLNELRQACENEVLIEKTKYTDYSFKRTSNLLAYIEWFNRLSWLVCSEIVKILDEYQRVKMVELFVDTALYCYKIGNYNCVMATIAGLQSYPVTRLRQTWNYIDKSKIEKLVYFSNPLNNYRNYRNLLKNNRNKKPNKLYIPAFSVVMKDLNIYFNNFSSNNKKSYIAISKFWEISKYLMNNFNKEHISKANFSNNNFIYNYLLTEPLLREDACLYLSFKCEKPVNESEENRLRNLNEKLLSKD